MTDIFAKLNLLKKNSAAVPTGAVEFIVAGLGNPGARYENTRHNAGFMALNKACEKLGIKADRLRFKSLTGEAMIEGRRVLFLKPETFMNLSGEAVREAAQFYKVEPTNIIVIFDDVSLDVGAVRIRRSGSDGGHNGMKNIIYLSGSDAYPRIKIGVGKKPHQDYDLADWVLSRFTDDDMKALAPVFDNTIDMLKKIIGGDIDGAMNNYNRQKID